MIAVEIVGNKKKSLNLWCNYTPQKFCAEVQLPAAENFIQLQFENTSKYAKHITKYTSETKFTETKPAASIASPQILHELNYRLIKPEETCHFSLIYQLPNIG